MIVPRKLWDLCFRWFKRSLAKPTYRSAGEGDLFAQSDINLVCTDVRADGVQQKAKLFFAIIDRALNLGLSVSVVVHTQNDCAEGIEALYRKAFYQFKQRAEFKIVVGQFKRASSRPKVFLILVLALFLRLVKNGSKPSLDLTITMATILVRQWQFGQIFDDFPARAWLGLTGGIELPTFVARRDHFDSKASVSALQFGQVSEDQYHFEGYSVDNLFVYDDYARQEMSRKVARTCELTVSGSPEFEYELERLNTVPTRPYSGRVEVLFIDQPLQQRSEYDNAFIHSLENVLRDLSDSGFFSVVIKSHPRGSAFKELPSKLYFKGDIIECLPHAHVVVTCFSNLADLSVLKGTKTLYVGADRVLTPGKVQWIADHGGIVLDGPKELGAELEREWKLLERNEPSITCCPARKTQRTASQIIISKILNCDAA